MQVYQTDRNGIFVGAAQADESPLEPGVYLVPAGCVLVPPPAIPAGFRAKWSGAAWLLEDASTGLPADPGGLTPQQLRSGMSLTFAQLLIGLVEEQWITEDEGRAWRDRVALPAPVTTLIASLPASEQFAAETRAMAPSVVLRLDPLVVSLAAAQGKSAEQLDAFFTTYSQV